MCGIAGFAGSGNQDTLGRMVAAVRHRGPDDQGFFVSGSVGLGHARLSIIDLSPTGKQPMLSADGNAVIIFNGEIYNFRELKSELLQKNSYPFRGSSDTEVMLALYQTDGIDFLKKINGMFALALYDKQKGLLFLARDRMGKKPLYYGVFGNTLIFGSEPKALLQHPACTRKLNFEALNDYLHYEYVPTPNCIFEGIHKLEPAHYALWQNEKFTTHSFWSMDFTENKIPEPETLKQLDAAIQRSVSQRLVADVPLGIFLSGGLDSSTIAYYAQKASTQKIKTYSIGFKEASFDESMFARTVAKHIGTDHHEQMLSAHDSLDLIPRIAELLDEPMADASIIPTYLLSKFTREYVTVALGGDGGDELFAGYPTFQAFKLARWYRRIPRGLRRSMLEPLLSLLPSSERNMSAGFLARRFVAGTIAAEAYQNQVWLSAFSGPERSQLFAPDVWAQLSHKSEFETIDRYRDEIASASEENKLLYAYMRTYMMDEVLVKVDRASMYNSLEVRAPFLDYELVDYVNHLPFSYKLRGFTTKYLLKRLMHNKLPSHIVYRKKKGFGVPMTAWLRNELRPLCQELLSKDRITRQGLFNHDYVSRLMDDHQNRRRDHRKELWTLMVFQMWYDRWYHN